MLTRNAIAAAAILSLCSNPHSNNAVLAFSTSRPTTATKYLQHRQETRLRSSGDDQEDVVLYSDSEIEPPAEKQSGPWKQNAKWMSTNPRVKLKIIQEAHHRAIKNKKRREPIAVKKERLLKFFTAAQAKKKIKSKVARPTPFNQRTPLSSLHPNQELHGTIISMTNFGVYVDVGTECDGLLHISQITREEFIEHPRQIFTPGMEIDVRIRQVAPELNKLQLTMLPPTNEREVEEEDGEERIELEEVDVDDELWGEIKRVTSYGAYVELGAEVDGFLHFMDHPDFGLNKGAEPKMFMGVGDRVRVWVSDVDMGRKRIKLTANRPASLPILRREMAW